MTRFYNNVKTVMLMGLMFGLILAVGSFFGKQGLVIALVVGLATNFFAYFFSDKIALATMRGQEVDDTTAPDLVGLVRRLATNAGLPMPRVYICPQQAPNAFATGRSPAHAAVAVTEGAIKLLTFDELEGVIGHELSHVKNRDTLTSAVAASIAGAISFLAQMAFWFGAGNDRDRNPLAMILMMILAPIAAALVQMAISRSREYVADADGARLAGTPNGLISALRKLDAVSKRIPLEGEMPTQNHMFIVQPFTAKNLANLFSTHPPTEARIARLMEQA
jgi:heat shock protein HtpX